MVGAEEGAEHRRPALLQKTILIAGPDFEILTTRLAGWDLDAIFEAEPLETLVPGIAFCVVLENAPAPLSMNKSFCGCCENNHHLLIIDE